MVKLRLFLFTILTISFISLASAATCSIIPSVCISSSSGVGSVNASDYWGNLFKTVGTNFYGASCSIGQYISGTYGNGTLICSTPSGSGGGSNSTYNATYNTWAYNQTTPAVNTLNNSYGKFWYNMTSAGSGGTYNETYATWLPNYTLFRPFWYNMTYSGSTFNSTYANFAYNHTTVANTTLVNAYGRWWYNMTYSGSTFNSTYNTWAYNQTTPAVNTLNNSYAPLWYNYSNAKITPAQTSQTNLSNVAAINFTSSSGYITSNSTCIRIINGGTELAICS